MKINMPAGMDKLPSAKTPENIQLDPEILEAIYTNKDQDLKTLSDEKVVMLVFLRHFGCSFCKEAMSDLAALRCEIETANIELVMVHMGEDEVAEAYFQHYGLTNVAHISDPDLSLYEFFGLHKGTFWQLYGLKTWFRGMQLAWRGDKKLEIDEPRLGKTTQMPGIFLLHHQQIIHKFIHKTAADRPDYQKIKDAGSSIKES